MGLFPKAASILDVGCGNGEIAFSVAAAGRRVVGAETRSRAYCRIPYFVFDGFELPCEADAVDWVVFVDVLHHAEDPAGVLRDAVRVARQGLIIKDHYGDTPWSRKILSLMDWVGNRHLSVDLQANYLSRLEWQALWRANGLVEDSIDENLGLYPALARPLFENRLHFLARLVKF